MKPLALKFNRYFYFKLLTYHFKNSTPKLAFNQVNNLFSDQYKIKGFDQYNFLIDINACFSTSPLGDIIDRTKTLKMPINFKIDRPWTAYTTPLDLEECFKLRIQELCATNKTIYAFWSGGIDSTAMIVGFLKHCSNLSQLKIVYAPSAMKENPLFFFYLSEHPQIELIDFSGENYLNQTFDGIFVSGDIADDITASIDYSFFNSVGYNGLFKPWESFLYEKTKNTDLVDFYKEYTNQSNIPITTVLEARWWFYVMCKIQKFPAAFSSLLNDDQSLAIGFYDTTEFENYAANNINNIITNKNYYSYKQFLKDYIFEFDKNQEYRTFKTKINSTQTVIYAAKKTVLHDSRYLILLEDGTRIRTSNLPFLTEVNYRKEFGDSLNYLFNT